MSRIHYNISAPYKSDDLFDLVADIESYPLFLPWCRAARIINRENNIIIAELAVRYKVFSSKYTSKVTFVPKQEIIVELVNGPFNYLQNNWKFIADQQNTKIEFELDFELKSRVLENFLNQDLNKHAKTLLDAFLKRAEALTN